MPDPGSIDLGRNASRLRLDTLVRLRWLAVAGQSLAIVVVHFGLGFPVPMVGCLLVVTISVFLNLALRARYPVSHRLSDGAAWAVLAYDILQLAALLYLTGGLENPFAMLFLAPVMISATALPPWRTAMLGLLAIGAATLLAFYHHPLPWSPDQAIQLPLMYRAGIWSAILLGLAFIGVYAWRVAEEARLLAQALAATELVLAREQHLSQLDGLAAAAAHELGTPLATISLVAKELRKLGPTSGPISEDIDLLVEQVDRCRGILGKLTSLSADPDGPLDTMRLSHLIEEVCGPHRNFGLAIDVALDGVGAEPSCRRNPGMLYGLGNLVENALDFGVEQVGLAASWDDREVRLAIFDDGPGFPADVLARLGDPYLTTRGVSRRPGSLRPGMGLGLFIAKTLLERSGATLRFGNRPAPDRGALVTVVWPRLAFERTPAALSAPMEPAFPL